jgi:hypothetical protein
VTAWYAGQEFSPDRHTKQSLTQTDHTRWRINTIRSPGDEHLTLETCREIKWINKCMKKCIRLVSNKNLKCLLNGVLSATKMFSVGRVPNRSPNFEWVHICLHYQKMIWRLTTVLRLTYSYRTGHAVLWRVLSFEDRTLGPVVRIPLGTWMYNRNRASANVRFFQPTWFTIS